MKIKQWNTSNWVPLLQILLHPLNNDKTGHCTKYLKSASEILVGSGPLGPHCEWRHCKWILFVFFRVGFFHRLFFRHFCSSDEVAREQGKKNSIFNKTFFFFQTSADSKFLHQAHFLASFFSFFQVVHVDFSSTFGGSTTRHICSTWEFWRMGKYFRVFDQRKR